MSDSEKDTDSNKSNTNTTQLKQEKNRTANNIKITNTDESNDNDFIDHARLALLSKVLSESQMNRYGEFKKSSIENRRNIKTTNKIEYPRIKRIIQSVLGEHTSIGQSVQIVMHGITKVYAGELIEEAKKILFEEINEGIEKNVKTIQPRHLKEARRRLMKRGSLISHKSEYPFK
jgi:hypothetical protein